jgi:hypothetical protein
LFAKKVDEDTAGELHLQPAVLSDMAPEMAPVSNTSSNGTKMAPNSDTSPKTKQASRLIKAS